MLIRMHHIHTRHRPRHSPVALRRRTAAENIGVDSAWRHSSTQSLIREHGENDARKCVRSFARSAFVRSFQPFQKRRKIRRRTNERTAFRLSFVRSFVRPSVRPFVRSSVGGHWRARAFPSLLHNVVRCVVVLFRLMVDAHTTVRPSTLPLPLVGSLVRWSGWVDRGVKEQGMRRRAR